jgi:hypothetical protein
VKGIPIKDQNRKSCDKTGTTCSRRAWSRDRLRAGPSASRRLRARSPRFRHEERELAGTSGRKTPWKKLRSHGACRAEGLLGRPAPRSKARAGSRMPAPKNSALATGHSSSTRTGFPSGKNSDRSISAILTTSSRGICEKYARRGASAVEPSSQSQLQWSSLRSTGSPSRRDRRAAVSITIPCRAVAVSHNSHPITRQTAICVSRAMPSRTKTDSSARSRALIPQTIRLSRPARRYQCALLRLTDVIAQLPARHCLSSIRVALATRFFLPPVPLVRSSFVLPERPPLLSSTVPDFSPPIINCYHLFVLNCGMGALIITGQTFFYQLSRSYQ